MFTAQGERGVVPMLGHAVKAHPSRFTRVIPLQLRRAPLLFAAAALALGVALSQWWRPAALLIAGTAACLVLAACALLSAPRLAAIVTLLTWTLLGWSLGDLHPRNTADRTLLPYADGLRRDVEATVIAVQPLAVHDTARDADATHFGEESPDQEAPVDEPPRYAASLQLRTIEQLAPDLATMRPVTGTARVVLEQQDATALACGEEVRATVRLYRPREFRDPGVWSYADWVADQQITATGTLVAAHLQVLRD